ncbi:hypothetical protein vseg_020855 [Gypsophila vaccaria]
MEPPTKSSNPLLSLPTFIHQQLTQLGSQLSSRVSESRRVAGSVFSRNGAPTAWRRAGFLASVSEAGNRNDVGVSSDNVAKTLIGTCVYTVSNTNNEFVLISDPNDGSKSLGLLCFRREDAESFLAQAQLRRKELRTKAKIVPITLDQVYMLKVEGIAFRFLPDPVQIKNAIELKASEAKSGFDGVPVFQSDLLVVKRKNKRYLPIYFRKEDIERELFQRTPRGRGLSQHIAVGSLEDVLKRMEISEKNSGWEDFIFIPPGKSQSQHLQEVAKA